MKKTISTVFGLASMVFFIGTLIYFAVDAFALYSENQFTGRMRSFDVEYWNAIAGTAILLVPMQLAKKFLDYLLDIFHAESELEERINKMLEEFDNSNQDNDAEAEEISNAKLRWAADKNKFRDK